MLKARYYNFAPLAIWRKLLRTSSLCQKYASENGLFSGSRCQIFTALGEETPLPDPPPLGRFAPSQFSWEDRSPGFSNPPKNL